MKRVIKKIILSVSLGAISLGTSLWASSSEEELNRGAKPSHSLRRKVAQFFSRREPSYLTISAALNYEENGENDFEVGEFEHPPVPPSTRPSSQQLNTFVEHPGELFPISGPVAATSSAADLPKVDEPRIFEPAPTMPPEDGPSFERWHPLVEQYTEEFSPVSGPEAVASSSNDSANTDEIKDEGLSPKPRRKSVKRTHSSKGSKGCIENGSPKAGRRRAISGAKKVGVSKVNPQQALNELMPLLGISPKVTGKIVLPEPNEVTLVEVTQKEYEEHGPVMEATFLAPVKGAPETLTQEEVKQLLSMPLVLKSLDGSNSELNGKGEVVIQKQDIQGGSASHKLPKEGVRRILKILDSCPDAFAKLEVDEKRLIHTLGAKGYDGFMGHYYLIDPSDRTILNGSNFTIAFALKKK